jgi:hypothetical protein
LKEFFLSKGFISGKIAIPELRLDVKLGDNQFFKKEEQIEDIFDRLTEIRKEFGLDTPETHKIRGTGFCGVLKAECSGMEAEAHFILIKRGLNPESRLYTLGHEYGHFLWHLKRPELIYGRFNNPELIKSIINSNTKFAILCGWVALKIAGLPLPQSVIKFSPDSETRKLSAEIKELVDLYYKN